MVRSTTTRAYTLDRASHTIHMHFSCKPSELAEVRGHVKLPSPLLPSMEYLKDSDVFLIDNGRTIYIFIGRSAPEELQSMDARIDGELRPFDPVLRHFIWQMRAYSTMGRGSESELRPIYATRASIPKRLGSKRSLAFVLPLASSLQISLL
jgi:hypothetical protein